jgi:GMP synthase (glutamine-hydrolysing)
VCVLQHVPHESLGQLARLFTAAGVAWHTVELFDHTPRALPWDRLAGLVILGGPMNVDEHDAYPFLRREQEWIRQSLQRDLPVLGICLGAQLLARALGARVFPNAVKEIGWYDVEIVAPPDDPLFSGLQGRRTVFQWHGDTFDLPAGAVPIARGDQCIQQAFRYGGKAYGLQFHVEVTADMVACWLDEPHNRQELAAAEYLDGRHVRHLLPTAIREVESLGRHVLSRFVGLCRSQA